MAIIYDRDFGRVWSDGTTPCVFSAVVRVPTNEELDELAGKQLQLIRELKRSNNHVYSILDLRHCPVVPSATLMHYMVDILPKQFKAGLKHKAVVAPEEKKSNEVIVNTILSITGMPLSMSTTFENALNKINEKRMLDKTERRRSFWDALFDRR
jgi:hypothetical protein